MEIEKDDTIPFLDTTVTRDSDGPLNTTVYRKPTHTVHHPQSVKRGIVKCLYDRARQLTTKPSAISEEKKLLSSVLVSNGYPSSFVRKLPKTKRVIANKEPAQKSIAVLPYIKSVSEFLRRCRQHQGIRTVFKSDTTLRSHLALRSHLKTPWNHQNKTVSFKRSHANEAKCTSVRLGDQYEKG